MRISRTSLSDSFSYSIPDIVSVVDQFSFRYNIPVVKGEDITIVHIISNQNWLTGNRINLVVTWVTN